MERVRGSVFSKEPLQSPLDWTSSQARCVSPTHACIHIPRLYHSPCQSGLRDVTSNMPQDQRGWVWVCVPVVREFGVQG